ncbi:hypothetical protein MNBD_GAMMA09-2688 [hydrothermal vent metagenome]|uniref:Thioredoxin domain-containing protein n=1 Tax=hydrothermal vent metagenome TaxID=652676 RepID=A0A3B0XV29_9ZZZZ
MRLKKYRVWLLAALIIGAIFIVKTQLPKKQIELKNTQFSGPAVILFRGDNSPSCQRIDQLVSEAEPRYRGKISFHQFDWSADNLLIERYQVRFLPTVLFIDKNGDERARSVGESPAVQAKLKATLARLDPLLLQ